MRSTRLLALFDRLLGSVAPVVACSAGVLVACSSGTTTAGTPDASFPNCSQTEQTQVMPSTCSLDPLDASVDAADAETSDASDASDASVACTCEQTCQTRMKVSSCRFLVTDASTTQVECKGIPYCFGGRRPNGLGPCDEVSESATIDFFLRAAHLEAASVDAFEILAAELARLDAPRDLVDAARAAARDETRHARTMTKLAGRSAPPAVQITRSDTPRTTEAIAIENAREGCVRETFAALLALRQSRRATDRRVRRAMATIARDEARHAALAWRVSSWIEPRLPPRSRARVERERLAAFAALRHECTNGGPARDDLGLPDAAEALALLDGLELALA